MFYGLRRPDYQAGVLCDSPALLFPHSHPALRRTPRNGQWDKFQVIRPRLVSPINKVSGYYSSLYLDFLHGSDPIECAQAPRYLEVLTAGSPWPSHLETNLPRIFTAYTHRQTVYKKPAAVFNPVIDPIYIV